MNPSILDQPVDPYKLKTICSNCGAKLPPYKDVGGYGYGVLESKCKCGHVEKAIDW